MQDVKSVTDMCLSGNDAVQRARMIMNLVHAPVKLNHFFSSRDSGINNALLTKDNMKRAE